MERLIVIDKDNYKAKKTIAIKKILMKKKKQISNVDV